MAQVVDGRLVGGEVEGRDLGAGGLVAELRLGPSADQLARREVVGGEEGVGGVRGVERRVERDDDEARVAGLLHRGHDRRRVARHEQDALGPCGHQLLDRGDLAVIVAVELAGVSLRRQAELLGLLLEAFLHLDEERVGVGLGDQTDDRPVGVGRGARERERDCRGGRGCKKSGNLGHFISSQRVQATLFPGVVREALLRLFGPQCAAEANWAEFRAKVKDKSTRYNYS